MTRRWLSLFSVVLAAFAGLVISAQLVGYDRIEGDGFSSIVQSYTRGKYLSGTTNIVDRERSLVSTGAICRQQDMQLPDQARIFMQDMSGTANFQAKFGVYAFLTYYLFPREIAVSLDQPGRVTVDGFHGRTATSDEEILAHGFNTIINLMPGGVMRLTKYNVALRQPVTPHWFSSDLDGVIAFLLPLLTGLAGLWLLRFLFPSLGPRMPLLEQLACGLGLGMLAVAALTLGVKLCGFHGRGLVLLATAVGALLAVWRDRRAFVEGMSNGLSTALRNPAATTLVLAGLLVFLILFRLAGLQGLIEFDAVMAWALKAKILHLYTGSELVQWFSNPRLAHAHLDYPTLVPSLHAATYDSLGHVNEFVTKFWPAWMLLLLLAALASLNRNSHKWVPGSYFLLLALLLLPATQTYVQREGGALPMAFFTVLGMVQCVLGLMGKDNARLALGLALLFGAAMAKFEGCVFLAVAAGWILLRPSAWPPLKSSPGLWRVLAFCCLAALPFFCLRLRIPVLEYESNWAGYALHSPGATLASWPRLFLVLVSRQFVSPDLASWSGDTGRLEWIGHWVGLSSLYNPSTLGLAWLCLFLSIGLWFAAPARRSAIFWIVAMVVSSMAALSGVFACFVGLRGLAGALTYLGDQDAGRYLFPILMAWPATLLTVMFAEPPASAPAPGQGGKGKGKGLNP